jgi:hypothetical protein
MESRSSSHFPYAKSDLLSKKGNFQESFKHLYSEISEDNSVKHLDNKKFLPTQKSVLSNDETEENTDLKHSVKKSQALSFSMYQATFFEFFR